MKVKTLVANIGFNGEPEGAILELPKEQAENWIERGIAEEYKEPKKEPAKKEEPKKKAPAKKKEK